MGENQDTRDSAATPDSGPGGAAHFVTTSWTRIALAGGPDSDEARAALEQLCAHYRPPIYAYLRRLGQEPHRAEDLTQEFFVRFLKKNYVQVADRNRGRFRSFLLVCLKHFLAHERDKRQAQRRGGGLPELSLDTLQAEADRARDLGSTLPPEAIFDRQWAFTLLRRGMERLEQEQQAVGKAADFEALRGFLSREPEIGEYDRLADRLGIDKGRLAVRVHRLRQRYAEIVRAAVAETVARPDEAAEELSYLLNLAGQPPAT